MQVPAQGHGLPTPSSEWAGALRVGAARAVLTPGPEARPRGPGAFACRAQSCSVLGSQPQASPVAGVAAERMAGLGEQRLWRVGEVGLWGPGWALSPDSLCSHVTQSNSEAQPKPLPPSPLPPSQDRALTLLAGAAESRVTVSTAGAAAGSPCAVGTWLLNLEPLWGTQGPGQMEGFS